MAPVLRIAPEWECWPLWDHETGDNFDPNDLGLPSGLAARIVDWDNQFQTIFNRDDPVASDFPTPQARTAWRAEGDALIDALRGAGFAVVDRR